MIRGINSFTLALRSVRPDAEVKVVWVNSWYDPGREADAAKALIDQGADVILQHTDSPPRFRRPRIAECSRSARRPTWSASALTRI